MPFMLKVFFSFDKKTLNFCQFYSGYLTLKYIRLSKLFRFLTNLQSNSLSPANILFIVIQVFGVKKAIDTAVFQSEPLYREL